MDLITMSFTTNPAMAMAVRHYLYVSCAVFRIAQDLSVQQQERESMYDMLMERQLFQEAAFPIVQEY
jgi:hypothetical protein